jgi:hypothetical protein
MNEEIEEYHNELSFDINEETYDDFDVEINTYLSPPDFKEFIFAPFKQLNSPLKSTFCKSGPIKLPKIILDRYENWDFNNYHQMELMAILYLHFYRSCDEWRKISELERQVADILIALPHFKSVNELITYAYVSGDIKISDFEQVIEVDEHGVEDVTDRVSE